MTNLLSLAIANIVPSPTNPRGTIQDANPNADADLVASINAKGVLSPILVHPDPTTKTKYQIVYGPRRWAACKQAGLALIPAIVCDLDDKHALEAQVIENLQRTNIHPLEEAIAYQELIAKHGHTAQTLADQVGKSKAYVYARMKLTALNPKARKWFLAEDHWNPSNAILLARLPPTVQDQAIRDITVNPWPTRSHREFTGWIENYSHRIAEAPWAADFAPEGSRGNCATCPLNSNIDRNLFGDIPAKDARCMGADCWTLKLTARAQQLADSTGGRVLKPKELDAARHDFSRKTWLLPDDITDDAGKKIKLPANLPRHTGLEHGELLTFVKVTDAKRYLPKGTISRNGSGSPRDPKATAQARRLNQRKKAFPTVRDVIARQLRDATAHLDGLLTRSWLMKLLPILFHHLYHNDFKIPPTQGDPLLTIVDCLLWLCEQKTFGTSPWANGHTDAYFPPIPALAELLKVDLDALAYPKPKKPSTPKPARKKIATPAVKETP